MFQARNGEVRCVLGPPCGIPPEFDDEIGYKSSRRVQHIEHNVAGEEFEDVDDDDLGPVAMPESLMPPPSQLKSSFQPVRSLISAPPLPPSITSMPPPQMMPLPYTQHFDAPPHMQPMPPPHAANAAAAVIIAEPQMRNLKKETTRFTPTSLQVSRPSPAIGAAAKHGPVLPGAFPAPSLPSRFTTTNKPKKAKAPAKSADEACEEFLREISDLL